MIAAKRTTGRGGGSVLTADEASKLPFQWMPGNENGFWSRLDDHLIDIAQTQLPVVEADSAPMNAGLTKEVESDSIPKTISELEKVMKEDPSWGTYNTARWATENSPSISDTARVMTSAHGFVAWPALLSTSSTFPLFPKLPPELRLMVWKHALPEGRVVYLRCLRGSDGNRECSLRVNDHDLARQHLACKESWSVFIKNYHHLSMLPSTRSGREFLPGFFNLQKDTLYIHGRYLNFARSEVDLKAIKHFATGSSKNASPRHGRYIALAQALCPGLSTLSYIPQAALSLRLGTTQGHYCYRLIKIENYMTEAMTESLAQDQYFKTNSYKSDGEEDSRVFMRSIVDGAFRIQQSLNQNLSHPKAQGLQFNVCLLVLEESPERTWWAKRRTLVPVLELPFKADFFSYEPIARDPHTIVRVPGTDYHHDLKLLYLKDDGTLVCHHDSIEELFNGQKGLEAREEKEVGLRRVRL